MKSTFQITKVNCNNKDHQDEKTVSTLCIRPQCQEKSACCSSCLIKFHSKCSRTNIINLQEATELVSKIQNLEAVYLSLVSTVDQIFKQLKKALDVLQKPIKDYQNSPNLGNLNCLGELLRNNLCESTTKTIGKLQRVIDNELTKIFNELPISKIISQEPTQIQKQEAEILFEEAQKVLGADDQKFQNLIEKAIELVPNNEIYLYEKGCCLLRLKKFDQAIESFSKSISIKPLVNAYLYKVNSLTNQVKLEQANACCKEGLRNFPNSKILQSLLNSLQIKQNKQNQ